MLYHYVFSVGNSIPETGKDGNWNSAVMFRSCTLNCSRYGNLWKSSL